jgi:hypothetical protein
MSHQVNIGELLPARFVEECHRFVDAEFLNRQNAGELPAIRNRHEAYGYLTETAVQLAGAAKAASRALDLATGALSAAQDGPFIEATQDIFSAALDSVVFAVLVAVCATNVTGQLTCRADQAPRTPMEMAAAIPPAPDVGDEYLPEVQGNSANDPGENANDPGDSENDGEAASNVVPLKASGRGRRAREA